MIIHRYTSYQVACFKYVQFMVYKLYSNKVAKRKILKSIVYLRASKKEKIFMTLDVTFLF